MKGLESNPLTDRFGANAKAFLVEALPFLRELKQVQGELRETEVEKSAEYWPTLEYWMKTAYLLEVSEVLTEILESYLPLD